MLVATAVLAVVAIGAAVVAVRAVRRLPRQEQEQGQGRDDTTSAPTVQRPRADIVLRDAAPASRPLPPELEPRVVEGRLVVPPTQQQVVQAVLGRPGVRLSIVAHGVAHALRAESRDRISALMRREYRRRRRERLQTGRRAVRAARPTPPSDQWLGS